MSSSKVQPRLGNTGFIIFFSLVKCFCAIIYGSLFTSLPEMTHFFNVPEITMNLTLILFFIFFTVSQLYSGDH